MNRFDLERLLDELLAAHRRSVAADVQVAQRMDAGTATEMEERGAEERAEAFRAAKARFLDAVAS